MKLFIWQSPFSSLWTDSICVAAGETVEEARAAAMRQEHLGEHGPGPPEDVILGEPDLVIEAPGAFWYSYWTGVSDY